MMQLVSGAFFISGMMVLGSWLESINGVNGTIDSWLTPARMGWGGLFIVFVEWQIT